MTQVALGGSSLGCRVRVNVQRPSSIHPSEPGAYLPGVQRPRTQDIKPPRFVIEAAANVSRKETYITQKAGLMAEEGRTKMSLSLDIVTLI